MQHAVYTDHAIGKSDSPDKIPNGEREHKLVAFNGSASDRELGLAYAGIAGLEAQAIPYLERAAPRDAVVLGKLALLYNRMGRETEALPLYEEALRLNAVSANMALNLGSVRAQQGNLEEATRLWRRALAINTGAEAARMNLAVAQYRNGDVKGAEASLRKLLELNPGATLARRLLNEMTLQR